MNPLIKKAWPRVHQKACDIVNASFMEDDVMVAVHKEGMFGLLDELEEEFGVHPETLATRADFVDDAAEKRRLFHEALLLARAHGDTSEEAEILDSLQSLDEEASL